MSGDFFHFLNVHSTLGIIHGQTSSQQDLQIEEALVSRRGQCLLIVLIVCCDNRARAYEAIHLHSLYPIQLFLGLLIASKENKFQIILTKWKRNVLGRCRDDGSGKLGWCLRSENGGASSRSPAAPLPLPEATSALVPFSRAGFLPPPDHRCLLLMLAWSLVSNGRHGSQCSSVQVHVPGWESDAQLGQVSEQWVGCPGLCVCVCVSAGG